MGVFYKGEMQHLRDKLAVAERAAKAKAQMKEKFQLRFKVSEERLKASNGSFHTAFEGKSISSGPSRRQSLGGAELFSRSSSSNGLLSKRTPSPQTEPFVYA